MTSVSSVNSAATTPPEKSVLPDKTLNQKDFFKLLMAQMTTQDPMNPVSNAEFMGQMAQFSTLEQTRSLEENISKLRVDQQVLQANTLIGRDVKLTDKTGVVEGTVSAVILDGGVPKLMVGTGIFDLSQVTSISPTTLVA